MKLNKKFDIHSFKDDSKWESFMWEFEWNWDNYIVHPLQSFKTGIMNLWSWRKIVWKDRWYDSCFLHDTIKFKLKRMEEGWEFAHYIGSDEDRAQIQKLVEILDEIEKLEEDCTAESDSKISDSYDTFGKILFSKRSIIRRGDKKDGSNDRERETTLFECLWD